MSKIKSLLRTVLFPVPYPAAIIWHLILGGGLVCLYAFLFLGYRGSGYWPAWGGPILLAIAFLLWLLWLRDDDTPANRTEV